MPLIMADNEYLDEKAEGSAYEPIIPQIKEWPIYKFYHNRNENLDKVVQHALSKLLSRSQTAEDLERDIARTYYSEIQRIKRMPWKVDKPDEKEFWESIKNETNNVSSELSESERYEKFRQISEIIVRRYVDEIAGNFDPRAYHFAKRFLSFGFASLLNAFRARNLKALIDHRYFLQDCMKLRGDINLIRELAKKGTVIMLPTHFSNLDSIILGWSIHALGLPAFMYGAGLNLYNYSAVAPLMNRLGAYKVDRRRKNPFYLESLTSFSEITIEEGNHSLFFPGGTRSRSGALESQIKLGLLGTAFDAQRVNILKNEDMHNGGKIFVVPVVISYHVVLEAKSLIKQYLKSKDKEQYTFSKQDDYGSQKVLNFIIQLFRKQSEVYLSFGKPMDLFGNEVDINGDSYHEHNPIDIKDYFKSNDEIVGNAQRENEYTRELGEIVSKKFLEYNIVLTSHMVAYVAYNYYLKKFKAKDIYDLFELSKEELIIPYQDFYNEVEAFVNKLRVFQQEGKLTLEDSFYTDTKAIIEDGITNLGVFHNNKALKFVGKKNSGDVTTEDLELLYYYHNRLKGYHFE